MNADVESGPSLNIEGPLENTVAYMASAPYDSGLSSLVPPIEHCQQSVGTLASTSQEFWRSLASYMRSSQFGPVLGVMLVAIVILMQASIQGFWWPILSWGMLSFYSIVTLY